MGISDEKKKKEIDELEQKLQDYANKLNPSLFKLIKQNLESSGTKQDYIGNLERLIDQRTKELYELNLLRNSLVDSEEEKNWLSRYTTLAPNLIKKSIVTISGATTGYIIANNLTGTLIGGAIGLFFDHSGNKYPKRTLYEATTPDELDALHIKIKSGNFDEGIELRKKETSLFIGKLAFSVFAVGSACIYKFLLE